MIYLKSEKNAFAHGGNRVCFVDPRNKEHCIKVARSDRTATIKKSEKCFPVSLKPLRYFDDNDEEFRVYAQINKKIGELAYNLIPRCFGFIETDLGRGLCSEIIKDNDGKISYSLKQYIWQHGLNDELQNALTTFSHNWQSLGMPSRNLLLHNIVVQQENNKILRLVVIDGLGWPDLIPLANYFQFLAVKKATRKASRLPKKINELLKIKREGGDWGYHGWLNDNERIIQ